MEQLSSITKSFSNIEKHYTIFNVCYKQCYCQRRLYKQGFNSGHSISLIFLLCFSWNNHNKSHALDRISVFVFIYFFSQFFFLLPIALFFCCSSKYSHTLPKSPANTTEDQSLVVCGERGVISKSNRWIKTVSLLK